MYNLIINYKQEKSKVATHRDRFDGETIVKLDLPEPNAVIFIVL